MSETTLSAAPAERASLAGWSPAWRMQVLGADLDSPAGVLGAAIRRAEHAAADRVFNALTSPERHAPADIPVHTLLLKPVGDRCNLACPYCYEDDRRTTVDAGRVDLKAACAMLDNLLPYAERPFRIFLHGGEPLLAGRDYFAALIRHARDHHGEGVHWGVQTNGVLIDPEWARFFRDNAFWVGVSLDGPPDIHDAQRPDKRGAPSHEAIVRGLGVLRDEGVPFGVTAVITAAQAARPDAAAELFDHFVSLGIEQFDAHPAYAPIGPSTPWNLTPGAYVAFMLDLFDAWLTRANPRVRIRTFEEYFRILAGLDADTCHRSGRCTSIIGADPNGAAMACTRPFGAQYGFGDLSRTPATQIVTSPGFALFAAHEAEGRRKARNCRYLPFCGGGCPHERLTADGQQAVDGRHVYCTCHDGASGGIPALIDGMLARMQSV